ncbi:MAG TPA: hypothetical protein VG323_18045 [Thermoanaerobaculia bacterium]|nr:hypothetical protein [Thermoanaerobaculia bacterium]
MSWRFHAVLFTFLCTAAAAADPLIEARAALQRFTGKQPLHAAVELRRSRHAHGRFLNDDFDGSATFEIEADANVVRVTYARALLERGAAEPARHRALTEAQPIAIADAIDGAAPLLRLLGSGRVIDVHDGHFTMQLPPAATGASTEIGGVDVTDDRLTVWLGNDGVPLSARRERHGSTGLLFLRINSVRTETWSFGVRGDHLVALRFEDQSTVTGPGQRGEAHSVWTVRPR